MMIHKTDICDDVVPEHMRDDRGLMNAVHHFIGATINLTICLTNPHHEKVPSFIRETLKNFFKHVGGINEEETSRCPQVVETNKGKGKKNLGHFD